MVVNTERNKLPNCLKKMHISNYMSVGYEVLKCIKCYKELKKVPSKMSSIHVCLV